MKVIECKPHVSVSHQHVSDTIHAFDLKCLCYIAGIAKKKLNVKHLNIENNAGHQLISCFSEFLLFLHGSLPDKKRVEGDNPDNQFEPSDRMKLV